MLLRPRTKCQEVDRDAIGTPQCSSRRSSNPDLLLGCASRGGSNAISQSGCQCRGCGVGDHRFLSGCYVPPPGTPAPPVAAVAPDQTLPAAVVTPTPLTPADPYAPPPQVETRRPRRHRWRCGSLGIGIGTGRSLVGRRAIMSNGRHRPQIGCQVTGRRDRPAGPGSTTTGANRLISRLKPSQVPGGWRDLFRLRLLHRCSIAGVLAATGANGWPIAGI
jgi:hypothetical protein